MDKKDVVYMAENYQIIMQELVRRSNEETRRLRTVEQRLDAIEDKLNALIENSAERNKKIHGKFADVDFSLKALNDELANLKTNMEKINRQLSKFAQKRDLREIEKMVELLGPLKPEAEDVIEVEAK